MNGAAHPAPRVSARDAANLLAAAALLAFFLVLGAGTLRHGRDQDFLNMYTGATLARQGRFHELHDPKVQLAVEKSVTPQRTSLVPFVRPHVYAALLAPLAALPHAQAYLVWLALQAAFLLAFLFLAWRCFGSEAVLLSAMFGPPLLGLLQGQDNWMLGLIGLAGLAALERGHEGRGGAIWSLALLKFHLAPGLLLALLAARRTRALAGFAAGGAALAAASLALGGWQGALCYWRMITNPATEGLYPSREKMPNLQGLAAFLGLPELWIYATLGAAVALLLARAAWRAPWWKQFVLSLGGWLVLAPHVYFYDLTLLLPPLLLTAARARARSTRAAVYLLLSPLLIIAILLVEPLQAQLAPLLLLWLWLVFRDRAPRPTAVPAESSPPVPA